MRRLIPALCLLFIGVQAAPATVVYRQGEGWSTERAGEDEPVEASASAQMKKAEDFESSGDQGRALGAYRGLVRKFPTSMSAPKAQFKVGQLLEASGDYEAAFEAYGKYVSKFSKGDDFDAAVEAQFRIAKLFLEGERKKTLGVKTFPSMVRTREMFDEIIKNAPFSKFAPLAQFYAGQAYEKQGKIPEALGAYEAVISRYPNETIAADAQYQIGYVYLKQYQSGAYDPSVSDKAREAFEDFLARYPNSEKVAQAKENLASLGSGQTKGALDIAKFYDKTKNYKAAVIYYNEVIKQQPGSKEAEEAKRRIDELKESVGEDALRAGPEKTETGARAKIRRKFQAQVDTSARPDFVGPPVVVPDEVAPAKPHLRSRSSGGGAPVEKVPAVEPALPAQ